MHTTSTTTSNTRDPIHVCLALRIGPIGHAQLTGSRGVHQVDTLISACPTGAVRKHREKTSQKGSSVVGPSELHPPPAMRSCAKHPPKVQALGSQPSASRGLNYLGVSNPHTVSPLFKSPRRVKPSLAQTPPALLPLRPQIMRGEKESSLLIPFRKGGNTRNLGRLEP